MGRWLVMVMMLSAGCTAALKTSSGGALSRPGVEGSVTNSITIGDRGGLLTRASLLGLAIFGAAGSVENVKTTTDVNSVGNATIVTTTTTGTVNRETLKSAGDMMNAATDPNANISGLAASLEIASRSLGGDTSGWMYRIGYSGRWGRGRGLGVRLFAGLGFGEFTHYDRKVSRYAPTDQTLVVNGLGSVSVTTEDSDYVYVGTPVRIALTYASIVETYFQAEMNWITPFHEFEVFGDAVSDAPVPSPWTLGIRGTLAIGFVGTFISLASMRAEGRSYGFEAGIDF